MKHISQNDIFADRYLLVEQLGVGGFSEVWKAQDTEVGGLVVAVKIFAPTSGLDTKGLEIFSKEYGLVFNLNNANLLRPSYYGKCDGSPYLVMPYCKNGSALDKIGEISEKELAAFMQQASSALAYLHKQEPPIIHQDIKPDNFLIDDDGNYLLADFGISSRIRRTLTKSMGDKVSAGTLAYMPPEKWGRDNEKKTIKEGDVFSLGVTMYELLSGELPFGEHGGVMLNTGAEIPDLPNRFSSELNKLLRHCMAKEPEERPTTKDLEEIATNYLKTGNWQTIKTPKTKPAKKPEPELKRKGCETATMHFTPEYTPTSSQSSSQSSMPNLPSIPAVGRKKKKKKQKHPWLIWLITLLVISGLVVIMMSREPSAEEKAAIYKIKQDSIAKSDSIAKATTEIEEMAKAKEDSIAKVQNQSAKKPTAGSATTNNIFNYTTVYVAGGTFQMGSNDGDAHEKPVHSVSVNGFSLGKYEVTQAQWKSVIGSNPSNFKGCDDCPVEKVSWNDIQGFIKKVKELTGKTYRLPTEAEWEYAARGGALASSATAKKYSGSDNIGSVAWYTDNSNSKTHPVGQKNSNELGIYDISGNVWEWCSDWYKGYPGSSAITDYNGSRRVVRGGSWYSNASSCRVAKRIYATPDSRPSSIGFRLVSVP